MQKTGEQAARPGRFRAIVVIGAALLVVVGLIVFFATREAEREVVREGSGVAPQPPSAVPSPRAGGDGTAEAQRAVSSPERQAAATPTTAQPVVTTTEQAAASLDQDDAGGAADRAVAREAENRPPSAADDALSATTAEEVGTPAAQEQVAALSRPQEAPPSSAAGTAPPVGAPDADGRATFDIVRVAPDGAAVIAGTTEPGAKVTVRAGEAVLGEVTADRLGQWVLVPEETLPSGPVELGQEVAPPGQAPFRSEQTVVVVVPESAGKGAGKGDEPLVVRLPGPDAPSEVLQAPAAPAADGEAPSLALGTVDYDEEGSLVIAGESEPGAQVQIYVDNQPVGTAEADAGGAWQLRPQQPLAPGTYTLRIDQVGPAGKVTARLEVPFRRAAPGEFQLTASHIVVQPGNYLWQIARFVYGRGARYTLIYQANRDQIRDPDLIYPGQVFVLPSRDAGEES